MSTLDSLYHQKQQLAAQHRASNAFRVENLKIEQASQHHWELAARHAQNCFRPKELQARPASDQKCFKNASGQNCSRPAVLQTESFRSKLLQARNASQPKVPQTNSASGQNCFRSKIASGQKCFRPELLQARDTTGQNCFKP